MSNLLEKASILTTPTAYNDGKLLSVKPSIVLGNELVTNGSFDTDSEWIKGTGWSISGGAANYNNNTNSSLYQNITLNTNSYELKFTISNSSGIGARMWIGNSSGSISYTNNTYQNYANGNYTINIVVPSNQTTFAFWANTGGTSFSIDNVSVKEAIDGDFDFTRNSSATRVASNGLIEDVQILSGELVQNGDFEQIGSENIINGDFSNGENNWTFQTGWSVIDGKATVENQTGWLVTNGAPIPANKQIRLQFDLVLTDGVLRVKNSANDFSELFSTVGAYTVTRYYSIGGSASNLQFPNYGSGFTGSIDNVSVKEVGQNWSLGSGWSIGDGVADASGSVNANISQNGFLTIGSKYKVTYTVLNASTGARVGLAPNASTIQNIRTENGTYTEVYEAINTSFYIRNLWNNGVGLSVTNISVKEITDDTNLPRIDYDGFSYQDALGSERVLNGDFSDGLNNWTINTNALGYVSTSSETLQYLTGHGDYAEVKQLNNSVIGKKYKGQFEVISKGINATVFIQYGRSSIYSGDISNLDLGINTFEVVSTHPDGFSISVRTNGVIEIDNVSVKEYLGQEVVPDSGVGHILLEPQSTNLVIQSELFSDSSWTKNGASVTSGFISPDGTANAFELNIPSSNGYLLTQFFSYSAVLGQSITASVFAKNEITNFLSFGGATVAGTDVYSIQDYGNGWFRHIVTRTFTTTATGSVQFIIYDQVGNNVIWGAQLEDNKSFATSYIPTSGSTVTRLGETLNNAGSSDLINSTEGVLYAEIAALNDSSNFYIGIYGNSNSRIRLVFLPNEIKGQVFNGSYQAILSSYQTISNNNKIAFKYKENDFALWINGVEVDTDNIGSTFNANTITYLNLAGYTGDLSLAQGKVKCVAVFKEALTDEELTCLTTI